MLIVGTPLLLLPLFALGERLAGTALLTAFATVSALGHHLPGMLRAYGDRALFRRFRWRFILAPIVLIGVSVFCAIQGIYTAILLAFMWGIWHWMMQAYGFMRIYDSKAGSYDALTRWLDFGMCIVWFGFALFLSPRPLFDLLFRYQQSGGLPISASVTSGMQSLWITLTILVTAAFVVNSLRNWAKGTPPSALKIVLMGVTFSYYWYTLAWVPNGLVAYALFEIFHDVQYLTIVWMFNRGRAKRPDAGSFTRFLFRQRGLLVLAYVAICLIYGSFDFAARNFATGMVYNVALALVLASSMLHFYFDGFIWKIREQETGQNLGLSGTKTRVNWSPSWKMLRHGALWMLFLGPLCVFGWLELSGKVPTDVERASSLAAALPDSAVAQSALCAVLIDHEAAEKAVAACQRAVALDASDTTARENLGNALLAKRDWEGAEREFRRLQKAGATKATTRNGLGISLAKQGKHAEAVDTFEKAIEIDPDFAMAYANSAESHLALEAPKAAALQLANALDKEPDNHAWRVRLAEVYLVQGQLKEAEQEANKALMSPEHQMRARRVLTNALVQQGRKDEAYRRLAEFASQETESPAALLMLAEFQVDEKRFADAEKTYLKASQKFPESSQAHFGLGLELYRRKALVEAELAIRRAVELDDTNANLHHHLGAVLAQQREYTQAIPHFERALQLEPEFLPARRTLDSIRNAVGED